MYNQIHNTSNKFVKSLKTDKKYSFLVKNWNGKRGTQRRLTLEKVIALNLLRFFSSCKRFESFSQNYTSDRYDSATAELREFPQSYK